MFDQLTNNFSEALRKLSGRGQITESNVQEAMNEVRTALLEADVHFEVVNSFCERVMQKALGTDVLASLKPSQLMIKIVYEELVELMGPVDTHLMEVSPGPTIVMLAGLQGAGKTTMCGKLATYLTKQGRRVMLVAADLQRPAAVQQLQTLAEQVQTQVADADHVHFYSELDKVAEYGKAVGAAVTVCRNAVKAARKSNIDVLILDTAGRLHINDELMSELSQIDRAVNPHQIFLVIDAMTGQDAVHSAKAFNERLELDGVILTKFDSDTRGGAALSVKQITGTPIKFIGVGEHLDALDEFHPQRIASRILGMGDVVSLVEKAQEQITEEEALELQEKMAKGKMSMDDFLKQLKSMRRMGSMKSLMGMLPGIGQQLSDMDLDEKEIDRTEAVIHSMTPEERGDVDALNNSRRRRIARGSGTNTEDVSQLVRAFTMVSSMSKQMSDMSMMQRVKALSGLGSTDLAALGGGRRAPKLQTGRQKQRGKYKSRKRRSR